MTNVIDVSWSSVIDRENEKLEFGACHQKYAWRPHTNHTHKFDSLKNAFNSDKNSLRLLLQHPNGNQNAKTYLDRGKPLFAAVWYWDANWAILCNARYATLVPSSPLKSMERCKTHNSSIETNLHNMLERSSSKLWRELDANFYETNIGCNR
jgi:hypothetical protein